MTEAPGPGTADVLRRFAATLALVLGWFALWRQDGAVALAPMALTAGACVVAFAVAMGEPLRAPPLTRWDEAAAWFLLACLASMLGV